MVICDIDNVLADDGWRRKRIAWDCDDLVRRFHQYQLACRFDRARNLHLIQNGEPVALFTAQPEAYAELRRDWCARRGIRPAVIYHRTNNDLRGSVAVKRDMARRLLREFDLRTRDVVAAYDDRVDIVTMYRTEFGFPAQVVAIDRHVMHED
jgi:hypothetical protein